MLKINFKLLGNVNVCYFCFSKTKHFLNFVFFVKKTVRFERKKSVSRNLIWFTVGRCAINIVGEIWQASFFFDSVLHVFHAKFTVENQSKFTAKHQTIDSCWSESFFFSTIVKQFSKNSILNFDFKLFFSFYNDRRIADCDTDIVRYLAHLLVRHQAHGNLTSNRNFLLKKNSNFFPILFFLTIHINKYVAPIIRLDFASCVELRSALPTSVANNATRKGSTLY